MKPFTFIDRRACAICDGTNETTRLCDVCRADPANVDWSDGDRLAALGTHADIPDDDRRHFAALGDVPQGRRYTPSELVREIIELAMAGDIAVKEYRRCDKGFCRMVQRRVVVPLSIREIATRVGCSHTYVAMVMRQMIGA